MKKLFLIFTVGLLTAANHGAKALDEVIRLRAGEAFTLHSSVEAVGTGLPPKYQWLRNGEPIAGAMSASYTIPAPLAVGSNVQFKRAAYTEGCAERMFTNTITITWCNLLVDGVCWADANVAQPGTFAARPDMYTELYQWNQPAVAWPATGALPAGATWATDIMAPAWTSTPCPEGWRLPTREEYAQLDRVSGGSGTSAAPHGGTFVTAADATKNNAVAGRFLGPNHATCTLPSNMVGCVFFSAQGYRSANNINYQNIAGYTWSSTQNSSTNGFCQAFATAYNYPAYGVNKALALAVRCVQ